MNARTPSGPSDNLIRTYTTLGRHVPGASLREDRRFVVCSGPLEHAISNFAIRLRLGPGDGASLVEIAAGRPAFNVYSLSDEEQPDNRAHLHEAGFRRGFSLAQLVAPGRTPGASASLTLGTDAGLRREISAFMAEQFFTTSPPALKQALAAATASAVRLQLLGLLDRKSLVGAAMVHRTGSMLGIYNLCVRKDRQNRGHGSGLVRAVLERASDLGVPATLQCDPRLAKWYAKFGFARTGTLDVFSLSKRANDAIMA